ncbi:hypothetical protein K450DRAFT_261618 [Umbelopsis ramanniana AG]|uniref:PARP-type domain-containing protein n=1 Tax=Umbelopsis ramanniana AG TaxID=1314678 RepID=A0AAD5E2W8_UMBRA|nr:uncharacterized protein K450DRAFT_261618 [Umbelopsis ramanniana AG]KAI8575471.1 hypothetical protein K450DRAFT_261618 [Umbelopsis ramanniana AG]
MPYHIEYAKSGRSKCKGPKKTCQSEDRSIKSGDLRLGSEIEGGQFTGVAWRHWKCTTPKVLENLQSLDSVEEDLIGFSDLHEEDQERVKTALEEGHVSESEEPEGDEEEKKEEKPKAKATGKKAAAKKDDEAKPKKGSKAKTEDQEKPEPKKRGRKAAAPKDDGEEAPKPAPKKRRNDSKDEEPTATKKRATKKTT